MILITAIALASAAVPGAGEQQFREAEAIRATQPTRARTLYDRAAREGHVGAQATLGMLLFEDGNRAGAMRWLKSAADAAEPRAMLLYGTALFNGDGIRGDRAAGYALVDRAARAGLAQADGTRSEMELVMTPAEIREASLRTGVAAPSAHDRVPGTSAPILASAGNYRIQLGAFRTAGAAQALYARLEPRLLGTRPTYLALGSLTRLIAGPFASAASAKAACRSLGTRQACFVVVPR